MSHQAPENREICLCFRVTERKILQYIRVNRPRVASQLSECLGAGTGCGWCRPFLKRLFDDQTAGEFPDAETYAQQRICYQKRRKNGQDPT